MATLTIRNVRKSYGAVEVLKGIDLEAGDGEFIALVGPSGCGKSTLLAMIAGLDSITAGEICIGGRMVNSVPPKDRDIAMVFQSYALYPTMTVRENITFGMESRGVPKAEQDAAVERVAAFLQIEPLLNRKPGQLSGGQRQRVAMGRALVRDPQPLPLRRAALQPRRQAPRRHAHRDQEAAPARRQDHGLRHPRPGRGDDAGLAHRRHAPGRAPAVRRAARRLQRPTNLFVAGFMGSPSMNFIPAEVADAATAPRSASRSATAPTATLPLAARCQGSAAAAA